MAEEIALYKEVIVHREDREFLLKIRSGVFEFDELMEMVDEKMGKIKDLFEKSDLPEQPDSWHAEKLLIRIRECFYN